MDITPHHRERLFIVGIHRNSGIHLKKIVFILFNI
jgi:hypothetical protein